MEIGDYLPVFHFFGYTEGGTTAGFKLDEHIQRTDPLWDHTGVQPCNFRLAASSIEEGDISRDYPASLVSTEY